MPKYEQCSAHHMIIADCCGLGCINCGVCKCDPDADDLRHQQEEREQEAIEANQLPAEGPNK